MCEWMSISPGSNVISGSAIRSAPVGAWTWVAGPTAAIVLLPTNTAQPAWVWPSSASNTRAGRSRTGVLDRLGTAGAVSTPGEHGALKIGTADAMHEAIIL